MRKTPVWGGSMRLVVPPDREWDNGWNNRRKNPLKQVIKLQKHNFSCAVFAPELPQG
jgi:hypothetical protein